MTRKQLCWTLALFEIWIYETIFLSMEMFLFLFIAFIIIIIETKEKKKRKKWNIHVSIH